MKYKVLSRMSNSAVGRTFSAFQVSRVFSGVIICMLASLPDVAIAESLFGVYSKAVHQDPIFESSRQALNSAMEKVPQARANLLPNVVMNANTNVQKGESAFATAPYIDRIVHTRGWTMQLTQPLLKIGNWIAYSQAEAQIRQAEAQFSQAQQDLILRVAQAFFDVLIAEENSAVAESQLTAVEQQLGLAKRNFEVGVATITDTYEAKSRFDLAKAQKIASLNDLDAKRSELEKIIGDAAPDLDRLRQDVVLPRPQPDNMQAWIDSSREQNPLVRMQLAVQEIAKKEIERNKADHYPVVDVNASYGRSYSSGSLTSPADVETRARSAQIGVQLTIPIYSGGGINARVREAATNYYKSRSDWEAARRQASTSARQAYSAVNSGQSQMEALISAVESSKSSVEANKVGYRIGTRINIDVLNAEQQLAGAQRDLAKTKYEILMQGLRLKASAGILSEDDLIAIDRLLAH